MAILLCFNTSVKLSIKELQESIQLPEKELIKQVQSLAESKLVIINDDQAATSATETSQASSTDTPRVATMVIA